MRRLFTSKLNLGQMEPDWFVNWIPSWFIQSQWNLVTKHQGTDTVHLWHIWQFLPLPWVKSQDCDVIAHKCHWSLTRRERIQIYLFNTKPKRQRKVKYKVFSKALCSLLENPCLCTFRLLELQSLQNCILSPLPIENVVVTVHQFHVQVLLQFLSPVGMYNHLIQVHVQVPLPCCCQPKNNVQRIESANRQLKLKFPKRTLEKHIGNSDN